MKKNSETELKHGGPPSPSLQLLREEYISLVLICDMGFFKQRASVNMEKCIEFAYSEKASVLEDAIRNWRIYLGISDPETPE